MRMLDENKNKKKEKFVKINSRQSIKKTSIKLNDDIIRNPCFVYLK